MNRWSLDQSASTMTKYTILQPAFPPEICYLIEVLYWRAFGRFPVEQWSHQGPWRTSSDVRDSHSAPTPAGLALEDEECAYADIPKDPRMKNLRDGDFDLDVEHIEKMMESSKEYSVEWQRHLETRLPLAIAHEAEVNIWKDIFDQYVDQFRNEICLDLQRGTLKAKGTELPLPDFDESIDKLEAKDQFLDDIEPSEIPASQWIIGNIDWEDGTMFGRERSYIWIHITVEEMLNRYPPELLIKSGETFPIGTSIAVVSTAVSKTAKDIRRTGRPSYPWDQFHVEIARMYRDGEMPEKKEAAIAALQQWYLQKTGNSISRTALGDKLTPYFRSLKPKV